MLRRETVFIYTADEGVSATMTEVFTSFGVRIDVRQGGVSEVISEAQKWSFVPDYLVIDAAGEEDVIDAVERLAENAPQGDTDVIMVSKGIGIPAYRALKGMGVMEYFDKPLSAEEIIPVLKEAIHHRREEKGVIDPAKVIAVTGAVGGVGASVVANSLAWALAENARRTMLIDLDFVSGSQYAITGLDMSSGFIDILRSPTRLDSLMLERTVKIARENLSLLSEINTEGDLGSLQNEGLSSILASIRGDIDHVIFDLPRTPVIGGGIMHSAHTLVIVTDETLLGMRGVRHIVQALPPAETRHVIVAVNRSNQFKDWRITPDEFAGRIGEAVAVIPYDVKGPPRAMFQGTAPMTLKGPFQDAVHRDLVPQVLGERVTPRAGGLLGLLKGGR